MKRKPFFFSLRYKLQCLILLLVALPLIVVSVIAYTTNSRFLTRQIAQSNANASSKTATALESLLENLKNTSLEMFQQSQVYAYLTAKPEEAEALELGLSAFASNHLAYNKYIRELHVLRNDGQSFRSRSAYKDLTSEQKQIVDKADGNLVFVGSATRNYAYSGEAYVFARRIRDVNNLSNTLGYLQLCVPKENFTQLLGNSTAADMQNMLLEDHSVVMASLPEYTGKQLGNIFGDDMELRGASGESTNLLENTRVYVVYYRLSYPNWYLVSCFPVYGSGQSEQQISFLLFTVSLCLVLIVVSAILARIFSAMVLRPLTVVTDSMKRLEESQYDLTIPEEGNDETTVLARNFNKMSQRIHELLNDVYLFQLREKDAQIKALQAYINPHFLYNTLDTICWMSRMENASETGRLVEALSRLFRAAVQTNGQVISVAQELDYTRSYLMIQECRYSDMIDFRFDVQPGLEDCKTVNFALQPLIENSIFHGIEPKGTPGRILIRACSEEDMLIYRVEDDGTGTDVAELNELLRTYTSGKRGLAIAGLHNRIQLCFGQKYGLHFERNTMGGISAIVTQPLQRGELQNDKIDDRG